jgi:hypothetical protein
MDFFFVFFIAIVLSAIVGALWWVLIAVGIFKVVSAASRRFEGDLQATERLLQQLGQAQGSGRLAMQTQIMNRLMQVNTQYGQLQDLERQRYDVRMGDLAGMAANAGIDWRPS